MAGNPTQASYVRLGTHNMVLPPEGPKVFPNVLDFTDGNTQTLDFIATIQRGEVSFIQSFFVDNSLNENALEIKADQTQHTILIPPKSQGYMPMFISDSAVITFRTPQANNLIVPVVATNTPVQPYIWSVE